MDHESAGFWTEVESLFARALELPRDDRAGFLLQTCEGHARLQTEVEELLESHDRAASFLTRPPLTDAPLFPGTAVGRTIGPYRLVEKIGAGGMGSVYRAERVDGFTQTVAIKLMDVRLDDPETIRRFTSERQILATLSHPNIVRLLDGRIGDGGQPYLVMEHVDGVPITRYCQEQRLSLTARLRLFCDVCEAVHDAHGHGIVHRDLKPANILVTPDGTAKVLDYGIGKLLTPASPGPEATLTGVLQPLTPNYASPEQFRGLAVTTGADVYALGVLLYELVTGRRPYETANRPFDDMLRLVCDEEPARPSAAPPGPHVPYPPARLKGDIDAIVSKSMRKEPSGRYASSRELAEDIARHLANRPVVARELALAYVAARLARRHRAAFAASVVAVISLVAAVAVMLWSTREAVRERDRATARFNDARQLANALIFKIHDQVSPLPGSTAVRREIVSEALAYLERLAGDPSADAALRVELAKGYHRIGTVQGAPSSANLGDREGALTSFHKAATLLEPIGGRTPAAQAALVELVRVQLSIASVANIAGQREAALAAARTGVSRAEQMVQSSPGDDSRRLLGSAYFQLASVSAREGLPHWQRAGSIFGALLAERPSDPDRLRNVALVEKYTGSYYEGAGHWDAALMHHLRARELDARRLAAAPGNRQAQFDVAIDLGNIALAHYRTGRLREAAAGYEASLLMRQALSDSDGADVLARGRVAFAHDKLANLYVELGEARRAVDHASRAVAIAETMMAVDPTHGASYVKALLGLATAQRAEGLPTAACRTVRRAVAELRTLGRGPEQKPAEGLGGRVDAEAASCAAPQPTVGRGGTRPGRTP